MANRVKYLALGLILGLFLGLGVPVLAQLGYGSGPVISTDSNGNTVVGHLNSPVLFRSSLTEPSGTSSGTCWFQITGTTPRTAQILCNDGGTVVQLAEVVY